MLNVADHTYLGCITNQKRESVTSILALEGLIDKSHYKDGFQDLGSNVHLLLHAFDKKLRVKAPPVYARYLPPYQRFLEHTGLQVVDSETEIEHPLLGYAGTLDKLMFDPRTGEYGIMDVKVSSMGWVPYVEFQTEAYAQGIIWCPKYKGIDIKWRGGIIMTPDCEMPKLIPHNRIKDISKKWQAIVIAHHAKVEAKVYMEDLKEW